MAFATDYLSGIIRVNLNYLDDRVCLCVFFAGTHFDFDNSFSTVHCSDH